MDYNTAFTFLYDTSEYSCCFFPLQIIVTFTLIGVQMIICGIMLVKDSPALNENIEVLGAVHCPMNVHVILPTFAFVALLVLMCTLYAFKTRNLPNNFNEAKFIGFAMYVTCITWVAFALMYFANRLVVGISVPQINAVPQGHLSPNLEFFKRSQKNCFVLE